MGRALRAVAFTGFLGAIAAQPFALEYIAERTTTQAAACALQGGREIHELKARMARREFNDEDRKAYARLHADYVRLYTMHELLMQQIPESAPDTISPGNSLEVFLTSWRLNEECVDIYGHILSGYVREMGHLGEHAPTTP